MGLDLSAIVKTVFSIAGNAIEDVQKTVTYCHQTGEATYDVTTGAPTRAETTYTLSGILVRYSQEEIDNRKIMAEDRKLLVPRADLAIVPTLEDTIEVSGESGTWNVQGIMSDPTESALWIFQIRKA